MVEHQVQILLVEDDIIDVEAILRAFRQKHVTNPFTVVTDGVEALDRLRGEGGSLRLDQPYLILLDINLPRMNGLEFLQNLRADKRLKSSIVFVLTTSDSVEDRLSAYDNHVAGYFLKSREGRDFSDVVDLLNLYWRTVEFPPTIY